jgi:hypothetical protein
VAAAEKVEADDAELEVGTPSWARQLGMGMSGAKKGVEKLLWQGNDGKEVDVPPAQAEAAKKTAEKLVAERAEAERFGLLQPLHELSLDDPQTIRAAVSFCDEHGASSGAAEIVECNLVADLVAALGLKIVPGRKLQKKLEVAHGCASSPSTKEPELPQAEAEAKAARERLAAERDAAQRLGLLEPLLELPLDDGALAQIIRAAVSFCDEHGATSSADLVECDLVADFAAALGLRTVPARKLQKRIEDGLR